MGGDIDRNDARSGIYRMLLYIKEELLLSCDVLIGLSGCKDEPLLDHIYIDPGS